MLSVKSFTEKFITFSIIQIFHVSSLIIFELELNILPSEYVNVNFTDSTLENEPSSECDENEIVFKVAFGILDENLSV